MMEKRTAAKMTKYATVIRRGPALLREWRIVVVPLVMTRSRPALRTLRARKM
jgi:hypothetical protein